MRPTAQSDDHGIPNPDTSEPCPNDPNQVSLYSSQKFDHVDLAIPEVFVGGLMGAMSVFLFASFAMTAVGKAATKVVHEVRRQFREIPGILEWREKPDYKTCVAIVSNTALKEMVKPGLLAILSPICVGFVFRIVGTHMKGPHGWLASGGEQGSAMHGTGLGAVFNGGVQHLHRHHTGQAYSEIQPLLGAQAVGAFLMFATSTGVLMALFLNNAGGAWDNAKKFVETGAHGGKGSDAHKAAVVGDTVGDPCKDTAGPSVHVLIKLVATVTMVVTPLFVGSDVAGMEAAAPGGAGLGGLGGTAAAAVVNTGFAASGADELMGSGGELGEN